jgi:AraC family transcriptional regulator
MMEPIRPEDLPRWVPGKILLASDTSRFKDVSLRAYAYRPSDVFIPPLRDYGLVLYRQGPTSMDRRIDGPWSRESLVPGNVSLLTRVEPSQWHWTCDIEVTHLYLTRDVLARVSADVFDRDIADVRLMDVLKADDEVLRTGIAAMAEEVRTSNLGGQLFVDALATQVCIQLLRHHALVTFREKPVAGAGLSALQARIVSRYIEEHLDQQLRLVDLAGAARISVNHFLRQFKRRFGCAPHVYVIQRRIARAQRLLEKTPLSIKEVAASTGFADQSHMTRAFQRYLRTTPRAYREAVVR